MSSSRECGQKLTTTNDGRCYSFIYRHFLYTISNGELIKTMNHYDDLDELRTARDEEFSETLEEQGLLN